MTNLEPVRRPETAFLKRPTIAVFGENDRFCLKNQFLSAERPSFLKLGADPRTDSDYIILPCFARFGTPRGGLPMCAIPSAALTRHQNNLRQKRVLRTVISAVVVTTFYAEMTFAYHDSILTGK